MVLRLETRSTKLPRNIEDCVLIDTASYCRWFKFLSALFREPKISYKEIGVNSGKIKKLKLADIYGGFRSNTLKYFRAFKV